MTLHLGDLIVTDSVPPSYSGSAVLYAQGDSVMHSYQSMECSVTDQFQRACYIYEPFWFGIGGIV